MASNHTTTARGFYAILGSEPFQRGYAEVRRDTSADYDTYDTVMDQSRYERGRLFSSVDPVENKTLWVCADAVDRFKAACLRKEIV
jgi:hypothetical protein